MKTTEETGSKESNNSSGTPTPPGIKEYLVSTKTPLSEKLAKKDIIPRDPHSINKQIFAASIPDPMLNEIKELNESCYGTANLATNVIREKFQLLNKNNRMQAVVLITGKVTVTIMVFLIDATYLNGEFGTALDLSEFPFNQSYELEIKLAGIQENATPPPVQYTQDPAWSIGKNDAPNFPLTSLEVGNLVAIETNFRAYDFVKDEGHVAGISWSVAAVHKLSDTVINPASQSSIPTRLDSDYTDRL
ncbi:MAG: hypothetical protein CYPHOPRED_004024 [Cyphobasidiales sp. Tagirdzhanova-0007]|nr:MAG: hypothetical protein CYPHOPRED_004024 [Cyphobasidiales sp. Tagirdzhanova-0007]